ncbi:MAG: hypothetical protein QM433_09775 [Euryarchaeota archaeon]|nr:hypothetical protein [Euryarchaeota archaeon]
MEILREKHRILAQDGDYHVLVAVDDRANEIGDAYVERLMDWIQWGWDWEAVAPGRDRVEGIRAAASGAVCYSLDNDDLKGLFGGEYADSPGALPGYLEDPDSWPGLQAHAYIPRGRFSEEVQRELFEEA